MNERQEDLTWEGAGDAELSPLWPASSEVELSSHTLTSLLVDARVPLLWEGPTVCLAADKLLCGRVGGLQTTCYCLLCSTYGCLHGKRLFPPGP